MKVVGLTGGIGAVKSVVAAEWARLGALVLEADRYGHRVLEEDRTTRDKLVRAFGRRILRQDRIDRARLAEAAFASESARRRLDRLVGKPLTQLLYRDVARLRKRRSGVLVIDAALICEWRSRLEFDVRVLVTAPRKAKLRWLSRRGISYRQAASRMRAQWSDARKRRWADVEIRNDGSRSDLRREARNVWRGLIESR
jgi:dephospho-CoA kinase